MSEAAIPKNWAEARDLILANSPWILLLIAGERAIETHYLQAAIAFGLCIASLAVAIYWNAFEGLRKREGRRRLAFVFIGVGAVCLALGIYLLAFQTHFLETTPPSAVENGQSLPNDPVRAALDRQLATARNELQTTISQRDALQKEIGQLKNQANVAPIQGGETPVSWQPDFQFNWYAGPKIAWIRFVGVSSDLVRIKDAYVISTLTGHRETLDVANATKFDERWKIDEVEPIPSGAQVVLVYEPKTPPSLPDFMSQWGAFEFHVVYDNKAYVKIYSQDHISSKMAREMPGVFGPRVTPRSDK